MVVYYNYDAPGFKALRERRTVAYHEMGHALVAMALLLERETLAEAELREIAGRLATPAAA